MRHKLKDIRISKKFTQEYIAEKVGIDRSTYTNIELGNRNPTFAVALKIKEVLNFKEDEIFLNS
jgi:putative transcriptional regulator